MIVTDEIEEILYSPIFLTDTLLLFILIFYHFLWCWISSTESGPTAYCLYLLYPICLCLLTYKISNELKSGILFPQWVLCFVLPPVHSNRIQTTPRCSKCSVFVRFSVYLNTIESQAISKNKVRSSSWHWKTYSSSDLAISVGWALEGYHTYFCCGGNPESSSVNQRKHGQTELRKIWSHSTSNSSMLRPVPWIRKPGITSSPESTFQQHNGWGDNLAPSVAS